MITCWICARDFEPDKDKLKAWAESGDDFEPTDWECPDCVAEDNESDEWDDYDYNDEYDDDWQHTCECGEHTIGDICDCCGAPMCPYCHEVKAGFCNGCPTKEWMAEQENGHVAKLL